MHKIGNDKDFENLNLAFSLLCLFNGSLLLLTLTYFLQALLHLISQLLFFDRIPRDRGRFDDLLGAIKLIFNCHLRCIL